MIYKFENTTIYETVGMLIDASKNTVSPHLKSRKVIVLRKSGGAVVNEYPVTKNQMWRKNIARDMYSLGNGTVELKMNYKKCKRAF